VGFEGAISAELPKIEATPDPVELARASPVLKRAGVRIMRLGDEAAIGVWSDLDGPAIRAALRIFGSSEPVRYLDGAGIPERYKLRRVAGDPVPATVLTEMERHPAEPWVVRDRMLKEMKWSPNRNRWAQWKAASLNRLFQEQGVTGRLGRITAATVRLGERAARKKQVVSERICK
jgi:hypothetical protein